ncbi:M28 family peptidase [Parvularcula marina]|uniref:M28 family peptidase n=1 Tax=Parvularcula marina TaxID=2292771 RepID=UPI00351515C5
MTNLRRLVLGSAAIAFLASCAATAPDADAPKGAKYDTSWPDGAAASAERFRNDLTTLAGDEYEGREAGTPGYDKAVDYVVAAYKEIGLKPAGDDGYLQQVPLRKEKTVVEASVVELAGADMQIFDDFYVGASTYHESFDVTADVVFMGYGLDAPMFGQTAYDKIDVTGKIVAVLSGVPDDLPSEENAHFNRASTKRDAAAAHGAVGFVTLNPTGGFSGSRLERAAARASDVVVHPDGKEKEIAAAAYLTETGTAKLALAAGMSADDFKDGMAPKELGVSLRIAGASEWEDYESPNVIGVIEGSDPDLKGEYVVLTAHLDHIGKLRVIEEDPDKDIINNGAMDNASGISTLLEEARKFKNGERPRRSILFVALTAEEKGLLGSEYNAQNPTVPAESMIANVNLDMPILLHDFTDVIAFGAQHSSIKETAEAAAGTLGVTLSPDPVPEMVLFVRSDHYNYVKVGIPSIFMVLGFENGGEEAFRGFLSTNYHRPGDDASQDIRYDQAARFAEINYRIAKAIANADDRPTWNEGDFFGDYFGK